MLITKIKVKGMSCEHCVKIDLQSGEVTFDKPDTVIMDDIARAIKEVGYQVET